MELTAPDYSNLINATSNRNSVKAAIADRKAREKQLVAETAMSFIKTFTGAMSSAIETQHQAQQAALQPELDAKKKEYDQILEESIRNGTTKFGDDGSVEFAPEVLEYRNAWLDDIAGREGMLDSTVEWAGKQLDAYHNMSDERARYVIHAQNANLVAQQMDTDVKQATIRAAQAGDFSVAEDFIKGLPISDPYKEAYLQSSKQMFDSEYHTLQANSIAATEGVDAAYRYISKLPVDTATQDTLMKSAYTAWERATKALTDKTIRDIDTMLENNASWAEIRETLPADESYSAYERDIVNSLITEKQTQVVTDIVAPYVAQVQSGDKTVEKLEDMRKTLQLNKYMFSGIEATYESYNSIISKAIETRKAYDEKQGKKKLEEFANLGQNLYDEWTQGKLSGDDTLSQIRAICDANPDNLDVINEMNGFVNKIISEKVPLAYRGEFNRLMNNFNTLYTNYNKNTLGGYQPMTDAQVDNYEQLYKDTVNFISSHSDLTLDDIDEFYTTEMNRFFAQYADAMAEDEAKLATVEPVQMAYNPTDLNNSIDTLYNNWDAGLSSYEDTVSMITSIQKTTDDTSVAKKASDRIAEMQKNRFPSRWKSTYDEAVKSFDTSYARMLGFSKVDELDDNQYLTYMDNKTYFEGALGDFLSSNPGVNDSEVRKEIGKIMETFSQPYATEDSTLKWGKDTAGSKTESFMETLQSFKDTEPFRYHYNMASGRIEYEWVNDKAKANWDNAGIYGVQSLKAAGYDVNSFGPLEVADQADPEMVFYSSDGKTKYSVMTDGANRGHVMEITTGVRNGRYFIDRTEVTPEQTHADSISRGISRPAGAPRNVTFDEGTIGTEFTTPTSGSDFTQQQTVLQNEADEKREQEKKARIEANTKIVEERNQPHDEELDLYISALRERNFDVDVARDYAPLVMAENERLKREGVPAKERLEQAIFNVTRSKRTPQNRL